MAFDEIENKINNLKFCATLRQTHIRFFLNRFGRDISTSHPKPKPRYHPPNRLLSWQKQQKMGWDRTPHRHNSYNSSHYSAVLPMYNPYDPYAKTNFGSFRGPRGSEGPGISPKKIGKQIHNFLRIGICHQSHQMSLFFLWFVFSHALTGR